MFLMIHHVCLEVKLHARIETMDALRVNTFPLRNQNPALLRMNTSFLSHMTNRPVLETNLTTEMTTTLPSMREAVIKATRQSQSRAAPSLVTINQTTISLESAQTCIRARMRSLLRDEMMEFHTCIHETHFQIEVATTPFNRDTPATMHQVDQHVVDQFRVTFDMSILELTTRCVIGDIQERVHLRGRLLIHIRDDLVTRDMIIDRGRQQ